MKYLSIIICTVFLFTVTSKSQELFCTIQVTSTQVQSSDRTIFEQLQKDVYEFMNNRQWTNYKFLHNERIESNILINVSAWDNMENFNATIQVQSRRPVFNSSYNTVMLNHLDRDFTFKYIPGQPIEYIENAFTTNLAAVLSFYAYLIIGIDMDSFTPMGGTTYFDKAQSIINTCQNVPDKGWKSFESQRNRYWMIENLLNQSYSEMRSAMYTYHRLGLDVLADDLSIGRQAVSSSLSQIQRVYRQRPGLFFVSLFMTAKSDELVNLFTPAPPVEKMPVVTILKNIDPANSSKYNDILTSN